MLRMLQIRQLALIEALTLTIENGFTCLTGETGAGKSILLDAVGLLLGARASSDLVRKGADKAYVEGLFDWPEQKMPVSLVSLLEDIGIECLDQQLVVAREVSASGKTVARVNGRMVTAQVLRQIGEHLVQQHGQHDSTSLLRKEVHLGLVDAYGGFEVASAFSAYQTAYQAYAQTRRDMVAAHRDDRERERRLDSLRFQIQEIETVRLKAGEEERLRALRNKMQYNERLRSAVDDVYLHLYEGDQRTPAILTELHRLLDELVAAARYDPGLQELHEYINVAQVNLTEAVDFVRHYKDENDFDPARLNRLEDRLAAIERLLKKYGDSSQEILSYLETIKTEVDQLEHHVEVLAELQQRHDQAQEQLQQAGDRLSAVRLQAAQNLERELVGALESLLMPAVRFVISFQRVAPSSTGLDDVEILFSANRGEDPKPLAKIASGGELSRTMLAFIDVLSEHTPVSTLIFDEIDTGISGRAAQAVAQRMRHLAKTRQVLCVTHLPQMASLASHHLLIEKQSDDHRTHTLVHVLDDEGRVRELARIISGDQITTTTMDHAREMIKMGALTG
ncbi:MAG: DNA repair protein RecN [Firmicutes bacterium]|nr:DNA repair protein RecN [Bacillota bacterium]